MIRITPILMAYFILLCSRTILIEIDYKDGSTKKLILKGWYK